MEFTRVKKVGFGIDMTPMIDCVFQLLIFFLLSSSFLTPALRMRLPSADAAGAGVAPTLVVTIDAGEKFYLNRQEFPKAELKQRLNESLAKESKRDVQLRADRSLKYDVVFQAIRLIQESGATQVHLGFEGDTGP